MFIGLLRYSRSLASMATASNFTTCTYLNNQLRITRAILINSNPDEYNQG